MCNILCVIRSSQKAKAQLVWPVIPKITTEHFLRIFTITGDTVFTKVLKWDFWASPGPLPLQALAKKKHSPDYFVPNDTLLAIIEEERRGARDVDHHSWDKLGRLTCDPASWVTQHQCSLNKQGSTTGTYSIWERNDQWKDTGYWKQKESCLCLLISRGHGEKWTDPDCIVEAQHTRPYECSGFPRVVAGAALTALPRILLEM